MTHEYHSPTPSGRNGTTLVVAFILLGCALVLWIVLWVDPKATVAVAAPLFTLAAILVGLRALRGTTDDADDEAVERFHAGVTSIKRVHKSLVENEELLWETKTHPIAVLPWWVGCALLFVAGIVFAVWPGWATVGLSIVIVAVIIMGFKLLAWYLDRLCITNMRLLRVHGILFVRKDKMALSKMTDASLHIPRLSTILNGLRIIGTQYGTLHVETAGQKQALDEIPWIPCATVVDNLVMSRVLREPK